MVDMLAWSGALDGGEQPLKWWRNMYKMASKILRRGGDVVLGVGAVRGRAQIVVARRLWCAVLEATI